MKGWGSSQAPAHAGKRHAIPEAPKGRTVRGRARKFARRMIGAIAKVERLPRNIGYLDIRNFMQPEAMAEPMASAMEFLARTDAMILAYVRALTWLKANRQDLERNPWAAEEMRRDQAEAEELLGIVTRDPPLRETNESFGHMRDRSATRTSVRHTS